MIKRIELTNFMSHTHTVIEPAEGLTVLIGPNNCGKSAFVTALQILAHNSPSNFVLRHGESQCRVVVETADGHVIQWGRKKNGAATYLIDGKPFDRLNRKVPRQVNEILRLPMVQCDNESFDVHFGEQTEPVFLLRNRGKASAQFFASSSDATHLVGMQNLHKTKVTIAKRDLSRNQEECRQLDSELEELSCLDQIDPQIAQCEQIFEELQAETESLEQLNIIIHALRQTERRVNALSLSSQCLETLPNPPHMEDSLPLEQLCNALQRSRLRWQFADASCEPISQLHEPPKLENTQRLAQLIEDYRRLDRQHQNLDSCLGAIGENQPPPTLGDPNPLAQLIQSIRTSNRTANKLDSLATITRQIPTLPKLIDPGPLESLVKQFRVTESLLELTSQSINQVEGELTTIRNEVDAWVEANPTCPTCGGPTTSEHLLNAPGGHDA